MEAVILSGGLGTRLRPLTYTRPKPLLPVANQPMLAHLLDRLPPQVDHAILAAGYKVDQIRAWADTYEHRVDLTVVDEPEPLGTGGAIRNVADHLTGPFFCFNGDVLSTAPLETMIETRQQAGALGALALWPVEDPSPFGVVDLEDDRITRFVEKPEPGQAPTNLINAGTYCFDHAFLETIPATGKVSLERDIFPRILKEGHRLVGVPFDGYWIDCGRPEVYLEAHQILLDGEPRLADGARLEGSWEGWACLGTNAHVAPEAHIEQSILFDDARVETGARLTRSILGEAATVGENAHLDGCVVADHEHVPEGSRHTNEAIGVDPDRPVGGNHTEET